VYLNMCVREHACVVASLWAYECMCVCVWLCACACMCVFVRELVIANFRSVSHRCVLQMSVTCLLCVCDWLIWSVTGPGQADSQWTDCGRGVKGVEDLRTGARFPVYANRANSIGLWLLWTSLLEISRIVRLRITGIVVSRIAILIFISTMSNRWISSRDIWRDLSVLANCIFLCMFICQTCLPTWIPSYIYSYIYIYIHVYTYIEIHIHVWIYICIYLKIYIHTHLCIHTDIYT